MLLLLLASVVRCGLELAGEVANCFDFNTGNFSKLSIV